MPFVTAPLILPRKSDSVGAFSPIYQRRLRSRICTAMANERLSVVAGIGMDGGGGRALARSVPSGSSVCSSSYRNSAMNLRLRFSRRMRLVCRNPFNVAKLSDRGISTQASV